MIFKVVSRADGGDLARYLLSEKNEQVCVLELRGTVAWEATPANLVSTLTDFDELARITKGQKTIVHLAINPSDNDRLSPQDWQYAIDKVEAALGLTEQPRAVVSHRFRGKEHVHVAWSRVDIERAVCIQMSHSKIKAVQAAREVELELGLERRPGRGSTSEADKPDQTRINAEKHQNEHSTETPTERAAIIRAAWHQSKDGHEFKLRMEAVGYKLASGNRGIVVLDANQEPHSIARHLVGVKLKDIFEKLGDLANLPTVDSIRKPAKAVLTHNRARHMIRNELKYQISNDVEKAQRRDNERGPEL